MTPLVYCLWGTVKEKCCGDKPETIENLKTNTRNAISETRSHIFEKDTVRPAAAATVHSASNQNNCSRQQFQTIFVLLHIFIFKFVNAPPYNR